MTETNKRTMFCDVTSCNLVDTCRLFRGRDIKLCQLPDAQAMGPLSFIHIYLSHSFILKNEAESSTETLVNSYQSQQRHIRMALLDTELEVI
jgi:hypothetical protein